MTKPLSHLLLLPLPLPLLLLLACLVLASGNLRAGDPAASQPFRIEVIDAENGWPVPMVQFKTPHHVSLISDNTGTIAISAADLMDREVYFQIQSDGYEVPADGFGYRGVRLRPVAGGSARVEVNRTMLAKRIGRLTGAGQFVFAQQCGDELDREESGVLGCDSVQAIEHRGRLFWLWGDTTLAHYPLGLFHCSSATTSLRPLASLEPPLRMNFEYFRDDQGRPRNVAQMPGEGPTWLGAYVSLPSRDGEPKLVATYAKIKPPLTAYEKGLCVWNDETENFERLKVIWEKSAAVSEPAVIPDGHPVFWQDSDGRPWLLLGNPLPTMRCEPTFEAWQDPTKWESLSPQKSIPIRNSEGVVVPHSGSIALNAYRNRWVTVFVEKYGKPSLLGEVWYAEAESPLGPWTDAVKVLSHENYSFYNPRVHAELSPAGSAVLLFEGTYTREFSGNPLPTPRYDYNQVLYRLDLDSLPR